MTSRSTYLGNRFVTVFQVNDISEEKKSCYAIAHFEDYANTWWEYVKRFGNELVDG